MLAEVRCGDGKFNEVQTRGKHHKFVVILLNLRFLFYTDAFFFPFTCYNALDSFPNLLIAYINYSKTSAKSQKMFLWPSSFKRTNSPPWSSGLFYNLCARVDFITFNLLA